MDVLTMFVFCKIFVLATIKSTTMKIRITYLQMPIDELIIN